MVDFCFPMRICQYAPCQGLESACHSGTKRSATLTHSFSLLGNFVWQHQSKDKINKECWIIPASLRLRVSRSAWTPLQRSMAAALQLLSSARAARSCVAAPLGAGRGSTKSRSTAASMPCILLTTSCRGERINHDLQQASLYGAHSSLLNRAGQQIDYAPVTGRRGCMSATEQVTEQWQYRDHQTVPELPALK